MKRLKLWVLAILAILVVVIAFQNTETIETRILFVTVKTPQAVLLLATVLVGLVFGLVFRFRVGRAAKGGSTPKKKPQAS